jgi:hypothetical protein
VIDGSKLERVGRFIFLSKILSAEPLLVVEKICVVVVEKKCHPRP